MRRKTRVRGLLALLVFGVCGVPASACGQEQRYLFSAEEIAQAIPGDDRERASLADTDIMTSARLPKTARADSLVEITGGLLEHESSRMRVKGVLYLARFAEAGHERALNRILEYWDSASPRDASIVLEIAGHLPPEKGVVARLVRTVTSTNRAEADNAARAVLALSRIGPEGQAELRRIGVSNVRLLGTARAELERAALRGFGPR